MTPKFQCGATCTKVPDREMLACESTSPRCHPLRRQADCKKAGVCGVSSKHIVFLFLLAFHLETFASFSYVVFGFFYF